MLIKVGDPTLKAGSPAPCVWALDSVEGGSALLSSTIHCTLLYVAV